MRSSEYELCGMVMCDVWWVDRVGWWVGLSHQTNASESSIVIVAAG